MFLFKAQFEYGKSKSKSAGEGARTTHNPHNHTRPMILLPRLYAILDIARFSDTDALCRSALELVAGGVTLMQYRNKTGNARQMLEQARELRRRLPSSVKLIMNDRADLCLAAGFDGVHVGQDDLSPEGARKVIGEALWLGVSTHNPEQLAAADKTTANYLAIGPVFSTPKQGESRPCDRPRGRAPGEGINSQANSGNRRDYPRQLPIGCRSGGGCGGGDIRLDTGAPQISRGIFPHIRIKSH